MPILMKAKSLRRRNKEDTLYIVSIISIHSIDLNHDHCEFFYVLSLGYLRLFLDTKYRQARAELRPNSTSQELLLKAILLAPALKYTLFKPHDLLPLPNGMVAHTHSNVLA